MSARLYQAIVVVVVLAVFPPVASWLGQEFYAEIVRRGMIWAIAAIGLDILLGYGGLVSFGHAAFVGTGAYTVAVLSLYGIDSGFVQFPAVLVCGALLAAAIGAISLRTSGLFFIMITLAFSQMVYYLAVSVELFGGDNGIALAKRSTFGPFLNLEDESALYYLVLTLLVIVMAVAGRLMESEFGMVVRGIKSNERKMQALGFATTRYKLSVFMISGAICGLAGALLVNHSEYATPSLLHWTVSGNLIVMIVLGGVGTIVGPLLGSLALTFMEAALSTYTPHWQIFLGPILITVLIVAPRGLVGALDPHSQGGGSRTAHFLNLIKPRRWRRSPPD
jgi:branched-chain amino acid transport system permease protein